MRDSRSLLLVLVAFVAASTFALAQTGATRVAVFRGARLINGSCGPASGGAAFVVEGARFTQVGRADAVKVPAGATRVDLAGKTVSPAILDSHVHLSTTGDGLVEDLQRRA